MGKIYQVTVIGLNRENMTIDLCDTEEQMNAMTVLQLKEKIGERLPGRPTWHLKYNYRLLARHNNNTPRFFFLCSVAELEHFQLGDQGETRDHFGVAHKSIYDIRHLEI